MTGTAAKQPKTKKSKPSPKEEVIDDFEEDVPEEEGMDSDLEGPEEPEEPTQEALFGCPIAEAIIEAHANGKLLVQFVKDKKGKESLKILMNGQPLRGDSGPWSVGFTMLSRYGNLKSTSQKMKCDPQKGWGAQTKLCINTDTLRFAAAHSADPDFDSRGAVADMERVQIEWRKAMGILADAILKVAWDHAPYSKVFQKSLEDVMEYVDDAEKARAVVAKRFRDQFTPSDDTPSSVWLERACFGYVEGADAIKTAPSPFVPEEMSLSEYIESNWPMRKVVDTSYIDGDKNVIPTAEVADPSRNIYSVHEEVVTPGSLVNVSMNLAITLKVDGDRVKASMRPKLSLGQPVQVLRLCTPGAYAATNGDANGSANTTPMKPRADYGSRYGAVKRPREE